MNQIIHNISVILIFFGAILLTYNLTKSYSKCTIVKQNEMTDGDQILDQENPSLIYEKMFRQNDLWMGYADFNARNKMNTNLI
jgi:hypothetical protein